MNKRTFLLAAFIAVLLAVPVQARDSLKKFDIKSLLDSAKAQEVLLNVPLYFADHEPKNIESTYGEVSTNKKTNAFMKSDREACEWAMLSALKALQERALREGMNGVTQITSNYKNRPFSSATEFECGAGATIAGVALKGTLVKLKE